MTTEVARADGDIERFIRDQKQKLQQERDYIMDNDDPLTSRRQWQRSDLVYAEEQDEQNKTRRGLYNYDEVSKASMNEKRREYQEYLQKGQKSDQKAQVDFEQWDREFQEEKRKEYNDYLRKKNTGRHGTTRKKNTPENEGLVFGEFEEYKKQTEAERKKQYKEDLERQRQDQLLVKMKRDFPNKATFASPPNTERQYREEQRHRIEEQRHKEFDKMLAQPHHEEHEQITPRQPVPRRSVRQVQPSPEFSDPGMQAQADRIRKERLRQHDLPTRPEEIERLQRDQQRIDDLERQLQETSVRDRYPERLRNNQPPPNQDYSPRDYQAADISPRQDAYAPRQDYSPRGVPQDYSPRGINVQPLDLRENPQSSIGAGVLGGVELSSRLSGNATKKRQLEAERTRETQMILAQQKQRPKRSNFGGENISLPISENDDKRKKLADERNKEMQDFLKKQDEKKNKKDLSGDGKSLPISGHEEKRRKLAEERRREYNEMPDAQILSSLPLGQYEFERERIEADRARERESQLPKRTEAARRLGAQQNQRPETPDGLFGKLGRKQEEKKSALNEERKEEYKQLLQKQADTVANVSQALLSAIQDLCQEGTPPRDDAPPLDIETRPPRAPRPHSEGRRGRAPPREIEPEPEVVQRPSKRQHQDETFAATLPGLGEREREEQEDIVTDLPATGSWSLKWTERKPGYVDAKPYSILKQQKRNQEYNDMKRVIEEKEKNRFADKKPPIPKSRQPRHGYIESPEEEVRQQPQVDYREPVSRPPPEPQPAPARNRRKQRSADGFEASLPGLKSHSAEARRKEEERNREYNDMLRKLEERKGTRGRGTLGPPRKGWQTPNYDDVLDQKRREEANYRRNDPFEGRGMKSYASEGAINRTGLEDRKIRDLDREYESRMVRFQSERARDGGILEDDNWLRASDVQKEREYKQLEPKSDSELEENPRYTHRNREEPETRKEMPAPAGEFYATLPLGGNKGDPDRESAKRRRKDKYRGELELQMREHVAAKNRGTEAKIGGFYGEKNEGLLVNASGYLDPEKTSMRVKSLGNTDLTPRGRVRSPEVRPYHTKFEQISNARGGGGGLGIEYGGINYDGGGKRERGRPRERNVGGFGSAREISGNYGDSSILDTPFDASLLQPRRPVASLPPGLTYQPTFADLDTDTGIPSTYITGGTEGGSADINAIYDAYRYYGMKNPLEPESSGGAMVPSLNLNKSSEAPVRERARSPRVTFDESARARSRSRGRSTPYQFDSSDSGGAYDKRSYAAELERQMEIKKLQKEREKHEQMLRDRKLEEDMLNYNPFGRAGGGAPNLDSSGKPIADLRQMRATNDTPRAPPPRESPRYPVAATPRDDLIPPPPAQLNAEGEQTYALGGHGIFGQPKTEYEKTQADKYKEDLRNQILEKKRQEQLEKERERIEEEKENRRLEEQRRRIQMEYEEEQRKKKEKEQENLRKQEELIRKNEEKRREAERAKREKAEQRQRERERQQQEERAQEQASQVRSSSPPIPAIRSKMATSDGVPDSQPPSLSGNSREASVHRELNNKSSNALPSWFREPSVSFTPLPQNSFMVTNSEGDSKISPRNASRTNSPPLAANRNRDTPSRGEQARPAPEPITQRPASSDVLKELASMRKQLENERRRVEGALDKQMHEPEVFDPRLVQKPPARSQVNVFESAKQGNAVVPQRVSDTANPKNVQDFQNLKFKEGETNQVPIQPPVAAPVVPTSVDQDGDTDSRRAFRSMFPDHPHTNSVLEHQQDAMLRQQEDQLKNLKDRMYAPKMQGYVPPKDLGISARQGTGTPRSMLQSNTAFIDVDQFNHFPEDFEDMPKRNDSARARRRERVTPAMDGPSTMGSVTSLDVDRLQRKNDARLRRLQQMNADEVSMADPDEILDNFMNKQKYQRPPSGQTLQDDTWLRPGSKQL